MPIKIPFWKKLLSWLYPFNIESTSSSVSGELQVNLQYGILVIDTLTANYSYGNLHLIFQEAINHLEFTKNKKYKILILGYGAGSISNILKHDFFINCNITGVELDEEIIKLSNKYFYNNDEIVIADAFQYIQKNTEVYDVVFIDLFINTQVPKQFQTKEFLLNIKKSMNNDAILLMNSMNDPIELYKNWELVFNEINIIPVQDNKVLIKKKGGQINALLPLKTN